MADRAARGGGVPSARDRAPSAGLPPPRALVPRRVRSPLLREFLPLLLADVPLHPFREGDRHPRRRRGLWKRRRVGQPSQHDGGPHRARELRVRDRPIERAHQLHDEPRAGARGHARPGDRRGPPLPSDPLRQGARECATPRDHGLRLPDGAAPSGAPLAPRRHRGVLRDLDGGRARPRAGAIRRDGIPIDGPRLEPLLRPARSRSRGHQGRLPNRRECLPLWHPLLHLARPPLYAPAVRRVGGAAARLPGLLCEPVRARLRPLARRRLARVGLVRARFPAGQPRLGPKTSDHPGPLPARARSRGPASIRSPPRFTSRSSTRGRWGTSRRSRSRAVRFANSTR